MRLGDLDWLIRQLETNKANVNPLDYCTKATYAECIIMVKAMATIEAEPVRHGRWINPRLNKYGHPCHQCNQCLFVASQKDRNFCPDCGAKMDLKE